MKDMKLHFTASSPVRNGLVVLVLFVTSTFVNKYVLTTLKFQYPTIFQGWQTLVGVILFRLLVMTERIDVNLSEISRYQTLLWLPSMMLYVWSIYSGSVALSQLPIPCYLALQNVVLLAPLCMEIIAPLHQQCKTQWRHIIAGSGIWISAVMAYLYDNKPHGTGYMWMVIHIATSAAIHIYQSLMKGHIQINDYHQIFLNYAFSMVILAPSTVLLGDAFASRRQFAFWYYYRFYVCCVLSGVCGICLTLYLIYCKQCMKEQKHGLWSDFTVAVSKVIASFLSVYFFMFRTPTASYFWILVNLACGMLLQYPLTEHENKRADNQPLQEEEDLMYEI